MSEANAEDGLFRQERTKYDRMDETNIVFVFQKINLFFRKQVPTETRFSTLNLIFPRVQKKKIGNGKAG